MKHQQSSLGILIWVFCWFGWLTLRLHAFLHPTLWIERGSGWWHWVITRAHGSIICTQWPAAGGGYGAAWGNMVVIQLSGIFLKLWEFSSFLIRSSLSCAENVTFTSQTHILQVNLNNQIHILQVNLNNASDRGWCFDFHGAPWSLALFSGANSSPCRTTTVYCNAPTGSWRTSGWMWGLLLMQTVLPPVSWWFSLIFRRTSPSSHVVSSPALVVVAFWCASGGVYFPLLC